MIVVGEAPARTAASTEAFGAGSHLGSGRRLADLMGVDAVTGRNRKAVNLLLAYPGDEWPAVEARAAALGLLRRHRDQQWLLCGRRVATAFGVDEPWFRWTMIHGRLMAAIPHPSGRNRWWNDPRHVEEARRFLEPLAS